MSMNASYKIRSLIVDISGPRKHELLDCIHKVRETVTISQKRNQHFGLVDFAHVPRKRWRVTYLKSRFKHRKAIRHYVFERYTYKVSFFSPFEVTAALNCVLSSLSGGLRARCSFAWQFGAVPSLAQISKEDAIVKRLESLIASKEPCYPE